MEVFEVRFVTYESEDSLLFWVKGDFSSKEELFEVFTRIFKKYLDLFVQFELEEFHSISSGDDFSRDIDIFYFLERVMQQDFADRTVYVETPYLAWVRYGFLEELKSAGLELLTPDIRLYAYGDICLDGVKPLWYLRGSENSPDNLLYWLKRVEKGR